MALIIPTDVGGNDNVPIAATEDILPIEPQQPTQSPQVTGGLIIPVDVGGQPITELPPEEIIAPTAEPEIQRATAFKPTGEALTQEQRQIETEESFGFIPEAVEAIPKSAAQFAGDIYQVVRHPIETASNLVELGEGLFNVFTPGEQPSEAVVKELGNFFKERYGGIENIKQSIATDPVGVAADISTIFTGGALAAGKISSKTASIATKIATATEPINLAVAPIKVIAKATPKQFINKIFESSAKFSTRLPDIERTKIVNTALNEGIVLSRSGVKKLQKIKRNLLEGVDDIIDEGAAIGRGKGVVVKTEDLISQLDGLKDYLLSHPLGADFVAKVDDFSDTLRKNPKIGTQMTLQQAQQTKKVLGQFFDQNLDAYSKVTNAAQDAIRRGIRVDLERIFPEIKGMNKRAGSLIALEEVLEPAVARIRNRDLFGLGSKILAGGGLEGPSKFLATLSETVLGDPQVKSRLAIVLNQAKKKPIVPGDINKIMATRLTGVQAGRLEDILQEESPQEEKE